MNHTESGGASPGKPEKVESPSTRPRTSIQAALQITLDCIPSAREFSEMSGVPPSTISEFRNHKRGITLNTLQLIVDALNTEQYVHFLEVLLGDTLLDRASIDFDLIRKADVRGTDAATLKQSFHALVSSYCSQCNRDEQLQLLAIIHQASVHNPRLLEEGAE